MSIRSFVLHLPFKGLLQVVRFTNYLIYIYFYKHNITFMKFSLLIVIKNLAAFRHVFYRSYVFTKRLNFLAFIKSVDIKLGISPPKTVVFICFNESPLK